ncbi:MAG: hypothetical protein IKM97_04445 [Clostridia bacterium]|nr:hypothetical protein [Clostridia bacterium]
MKIQSLAVIFAIIILPIIIILSYYIHREVDTIALQSSYDTKLIDATHDAMAAFEINTANEDLSSVADALRSIIEASTNVFFNSLATNLGMSNANKDYIQSYIPAILYTMYDGYYIYSPTRVPEVLIGSDNNGEEKLVYIGDRGVTYSGNNSFGIGTYNFDEDLYKEDSSEEQSAKSARQNALANSINNKFEYGQILYRNIDNTYSPAFHNNTFYKQDYILKTYMPYSARYKGTKGSTKFDFIINYTLDNYISVMGYIGNVYYSKTGYLIGKDIVKDIKINGNDGLLDYNEIVAEDICLSGNNTLYLKINPFLEDGVNRTGDIEYIYIPYVDGDTGENLSLISQKEKLKKYYEMIENYYNEYRTSTDEIRKQELKELIKNTNLNVQTLEESIETLAAITYYVKAQIFSNWVYDNLGNSSGGLAIVDGDIHDDLAENNEVYISNFSDDPLAPAFYHDFSGFSNIIFDVNQNPENLSSNFVSHKFDVIKNSIQYNLNLSISVYDVMASEMDIRMPVMSDAEWEKILKNVSIVSFMQGFNCGLKYYNNYAIVSSTNNELTVIPSEIYYVKSSEFNTGDFSDSLPFYHRIDCEELDDSTDKYISFSSKEVKYDKIYDKNIGRYKYDHKNFACYNCIVGGNYLKKVVNEDGNIDDGYSDDIVLSAFSGYSNGNNRLKIYYRALAKARQMIYKTNALTDSNGFETIYTSPGENANIVTIDDFVNLSSISFSSRSISDIRDLEISVKDVSSIDPDSLATKVNVLINGNIVNDVLINFQDTPQTLTIPVHLNNADKLNTISLEKQFPSQEVVLELVNVRLVYE